MINNDLTENTQNQLVIQLHIDEVISGETFDLRFAADPDYPITIRAQRRRILVVRDHRDSTNREEMDIITFLKSGMISVTKNCFGPPGQTYLMKDIYWGALCIYHTVLDRSCRTACGPSCGCSCHTPNDGYCGTSPYYPATYDPNFPAENHPYNQYNSGGCIGCGSNCGPTSEHSLCGSYQCDEDGCIPLLDCRPVRA